MLTEVQQCDNDVYEDVLAGQAPRSFADKRVAKVYTDDEFTTPQRIAALAEVLKVVDGASNFTVPMESYCALSNAAATELGRSRRCKDTLPTTNVPKLVQITMRRGLPSTVWLDAQQVQQGATPLPPLSVMFERIVPIFKGALDMHRCSVAHGDIKCDNLVLFPQDGRLRMVDFDMMFSYDWSKPPVANLAPTWAAVLEAKLRADFDGTMAAVPSPLRTFLSPTYHLPPDNILLMPVRLFDRPLLQTTDPVFQTYLSLGTYVGLTDAWATSLQTSFLQTVQRVQREGRAAYTVERVMQYYNPGAFTVYQLGAMLLRVIWKTFGRLRPHVALRLRLCDLVTRMMAPLAAERVPIEAVVDQFQEWVDELKLVA